MCGIAGYLTRTALPDPSATAARLGDSLKHRGPDEQGSFLTPRCGVVSARLSIIDIAHGQQPFRSADGRVSVVQNGEIYNFVEVRKSLEAAGVCFNTSSDTEVILRAYEYWGRDFISRLNGMFAIAILDQRRNQLLLYRDRLGVKPLFLYNSPDGVYFASEIKSFLTVPGFDRTIDSESLYLYLVYNYVPLPRTIFKSVEHVPPAAEVVFDLDTLDRKQRQYWSIANDPETDPGPVEGVVDRLDEIFRDAVRIRLRSDVPIGVFLSSGLDSSLVSAGLEAAEPGAREAYSVRFTDPDFDESVMAAETAKAFGWTQHCVDVDLSDLSLWQNVQYYADQPHGDISFIALSKLSAKAGSRLKVVYTGDGGDEAFAGYDRYLRLIGLDRANPRAALSEYFRIESVLDEEESLPKICSPDFLKQITPGAGFHLFEQIAGEVSAKDPLNQVLYNDLRQLLPGTNLVKVDRMTMAHSLEARSPFLDYRFYEFLFQLPGEWKLQGRQIRPLERLLAERYLPKTTIYRPKKMLAVPIGNWFRTTWKEPLTRFFESEVDWSRGYFEPSEVKKLVASHISGSADHRRALRALIALELWFRSIEGKPMPQLFR
ncbi:MAG: asparagine synthase (glutamine-hydrolyzing) [Bdellovibrionota bacterium]